MAFLNKQNTNDISITPISNIFIDKYLPKANAIFVKVYMYGYRNCYHGTYDMTSKQIADALDILESDVILAWKYWEKQGLVKLYSKSHTYDVEYLPIDDESISKSETKLSDYNIVATRPQYSPQEINIYRENSEEIRDLFKFAQKKLNKLLTYPDMNIIFSFYDWLRLPIEVIKLMLAYYCDKSMSYIEKVAIQWAEDGINTIDKAEERTQRYGNYKIIAKALGISNNRMIVPKEEEYMKKWLDVYKFSMDIIQEACQKAVLRTGNASFEYTNSILTYWHNSNVTTLDEAKKLDEAFRHKKKTESEVKQLNLSSFAQKPNRFVNYEQDKWDFEELEKLEREYINKNLER